MGLEPTASGATTRCSNRLSHAHHKMIVVCIYLVKSDIFPPLIKLILIINCPFLGKRKVVTDYCVTVGPLPIIYGRIIPLFRSVYKV